MSRADSDTARLRRLKRIGHKYGLTILAGKKLHPKVVDGGYMLSDDATRKVLIGERPYPYSANLDAVEAHLDKLGDNGDEE